MAKGQWPTCAACWPRYTAAEPFRLCGCVLSLLPLLPSRPPPFFSRCCGRDVLNHVALRPPAAPPPTPLLQSLTFAVMPSNDGAATSESAEFFTHVTSTFPDTESRWVEYGSESAFIDIIDDSDYSRDPTDNRPAFAAAVVFTSGSPDWAYTVGVGEGCNEFRVPGGGMLLLLTCVSG